MTEGSKPKRKSPTFPRLTKSQVRKLQEIRAATGSNLRAGEAIGLTETPVQKILANPERQVRQSTIDMIEEAHKTMKASGEIPAKTQAKDPLVLVDKDVDSTGRGRYSYRPASQVRSAPSGGLLQDMNRKLDAIMKALGIS